MDRFVTPHSRSRETFARAREPRERDRDAFVLRLVVLASVETRAETGNAGEMGTGTLRFSPAVTARTNRARAPRWTTRPLARGRAREKGLALRRAVGDASADGGPRREGEEEDAASPRVDGGGERERERATDAVRSEEDASDAGDASDGVTRDGDVETVGIGEAREVRDASALAPDASAATRTTATRTRDERKRDRRARWRSDCGETTTRIDASRLRRRARYRLGPRRRDEARRRARSRARERKRDESECESRDTNFDAI